MKRTLPSARRSNFSSNRKTFETSRDFTKKTLNLGIGAFRGVFPTLGRFVRDIDSSRPRRDKSDTVARRTRASVDVGLSRSNESFGTILNNQDIQNQLLERILFSLKSTRQSPSTSPIVPLGIGDLIPNILTALGLVGLIPAIRNLVAPSARPPAASAPRTAPPAPPARPPSSTTLSASPAARRLTPSAVVGAGLRALGRIFGPISVAYNLYDGLQQLARESSYLPAAARQRLFSTIQSLGRNIETLRDLERQLRAEEDEKKASEIVIDIEGVLRNIESQRAAIISLAAGLDRAARPSPGRATFTQTVQGLLGESTSLTVQPAANVPPPPNPPAPPIPLSAAEIPAPPTVPALPSPDASATRAEGDSVVYDFEKIVFEADLIKFDGPFDLRSPAAAVSLPNASTGSSFGSSIQQFQFRSGYTSSGGMEQTLSGQGSAASGGGPASVATQISGGSLSSSTGSSPQQITGTTSQILATIRQKESGSNYQAQSRSSSASGAYQFIDGTWRSLTRQFNIGTEFNRAVDAPPAIQDAVAAAYVNQILSRNNGDVSVVPLVWYTGNAQGNISAAALAANRGLTPQEYQRQWMQSFASFGGSIPTNMAQIAAAPPALGQTLAQASVSRVSADRKQIAANQRIISELERRPPVNAQQVAPNFIKQQTAAQRTGGEVPLKIRILSTFEQLARAS